VGKASTPILTHFHGFTVEGEIVGRLLTGYANLEVGLLNCVQMVLGDLDAPLKAMFKVRGESRRRPAAIQRARIGHRFSTSNRSNAPLSFDPQSVPTLGMVERLFREDSICES
jgi:hypothetical protein